MDWEKLDFIKNDARLFTIAIEDVVYPLCLTVKASELIDKEFGGVQNIGKILQDHAEKEEVTAVMQITNKLLSIMIAGGISRCLTKAKMRGEKIQLPAAPESDDLDNVFTYEEMPDIQTLIFSALNGGAKRNVETAPDKSPKNVETATSSN